MTTPTMNPLDKLAHLAGIRTARTDQLHNATVELFARLRHFVPTGTSVQVGRVCVTLNQVTSNIGSDRCWSATVNYNTEDELHCSDLEQPVGFEGYLHRDFNCPLSGPSRAILLAVGQVAREIVQDLITKAEATNNNLETATTNVTAALATVSS